MTLVVPKPLRPGSRIECRGKAVIDKDVFLKLFRKCFSGEIDCFGAKDLHDANSVASYTVSAELTGKNVTFKCEGLVLRKHPYVLDSFYTYRIVSTSTYVRGEYSST